MQRDKSKHYRNTECGLVQLLREGREPKARLHVPSNTCTEISLAYSQCGAGVANTPLAACAHNTDSLDAELKARASGTDPQRISHVRTQCCVSGPDLGAKMRLLTSMCCFCSEERTVLRAADSVRLTRGNVFMGMRKLS